MVGIPGLELDLETRLILERLAVGGVILFRRNLATPYQLRRVIAELHGLASRPLVAIDHEGGRVQRIGAPFTHFPPMAVVGATADEGLAERVGQAMARELASVGVDLNFAPVLDVDSNPENPIIGDRAFGRDPATVSRMAVSFMQGLHEGGVLSCGKHFPGHGDTSTDSHLTLPVVSRSRPELEEIELPPFREAIAAGVPLLMTAHVLYPALDPQHPATLSEAILLDLLRDRLGFRGVLVSDDLEMRAISDHWDVAEAAVATLAAGVDLLLICNDLTGAVAAAAAIEQAVLEGRLPEDRLTEAATRVRGVRPPDAVTQAAQLEDLPIVEHAQLHARLRSFSESKRGA
jgi:beta-N-acetylhexosaminidase